MARILVVDDHAELRALLRITLSREHDILEAEDGSMALEQIRRHRPDLVLLDVMMPGALDGLQVLQHLQADPLLRATRVIVVSARGHDSDREWALGHGAIDYFPKPFSPLKLLQRIRAVLGD